MTVRGNHMNLVELDGFPSHSDSLVDQLLYPDVSFELNCTTEWDCYGSSGWLFHTGGGRATSAQIRISVWKYQVEVCELTEEVCF